MHPPVVQMMHKTNPSLTDQFDYANVRRIPIMVTLQKATFDANDTVKVKVMLAD